MVFWMTMAAMRISSSNSTCFSEFATLAFFLSAYHHDPSRRIFRILIYVSESLHVGAVVLYYSTGNQSILKALRAVSRIENGAVRD
jgi:hypothetical protein